MTETTIRKLYPDDEQDMILTDLCNAADLIDSWVEDKPVDPDLLRYMVMSFESLLYKVESANSTKN